MISINDVVTSNFGCKNEVYLAEIIAIDGTHFKFLALIPKKIKFGNTNCLNNNDLKSYALLFGFRFVQNISNHKLLQHNVCPLSAYEILNKTNYKW